MFSTKIKYFLYGIITSVSLISIVTYANIDHPDGVFGGYFERMTGLCVINSVITGFKDDPDNFGVQECTTISDLISSMDILHMAGNIGIGTAMPTSKLDVNGKIQSETTVISDPDRTVTTKSYVDNGLKGVCTSMGGTWSDLFKICSPGYIYTWQISGYGACSASCGPGTQTATIYCKRNDGNIESDAKCAGAKPTASQSCNLGACPPPPPPPPAPTPTPAPACVCQFQLPVNVPGNGVTGTYNVVTESQPIPGSYSCPPNGLNNVTVGCTKTHYSHIEMGPGYCKYGVSSHTYPCQ